MLYRKWDVGEPDPQKVKTLQEELGIGALLGRVLVARGIDEPELANAMLGESEPLPSPFLLKDMDKAVQRIHKAVEDEETIVVFGDYDVDGITATALMYTYLDSMGATVYYKLPSRSGDGYGLTENMVEQIASAGVSLIITVDTGTSAFEAVACANRLGVDIVMTDHHLPQSSLPEVAALVNPHREDDESSLVHLSGVGVAFMVVCALEDCTPEELLPLFGDLVAVGTVADVMKLTGENRALVRAGLAALQETQRPGLAALIESCGWGDKEVTVENISYGLAPRLNAAGRMDDATEALCLLLTEDEEEAAAYVERLQQQNTARQKAEQEICETIIAQVDADQDLQRARVLVVWGENWHQGVIGIVASRLVERYAKPAIIVSFENGEGRGSGRSIAGFSLYGAISSCEDILVRYGGHSLAAGLSILPENIEEFRRRVNEWAAEASPVITLPELAADTAVTLEEATVEEIAGLDKLAPCGSGNPSPKFVLHNALIDAVYPVSEGKHSRLRLKQGSQSVYAVLFGRGPEQLCYGQGDKVDVMLSLSVYDGKLGAQVSGRILELRPAGLANTHVQQCALFESFVAGSNLTQEQKQQFTPAREDVAEVYRVVKSGQPRCGNDLRPLFAQLGEEKTGRIVAAVSALEELELIAQNPKTGQYVAAPVQQKKDLSQSVLLQKLAE